MSPMRDKSISKVRFSISSFFFVLVLADFVRYLCEATTEDDAG